jgi:hypothetical protein
MKLLEQIVAIDDQLVTTRTASAKKLLAKRDALVQKLFA